MLKSLLYTFLISLFSTIAFAQNKYTAANIHSHNDYSRPNAFYQAFNAGAGTIEADVYLKNGELIVAHDTLAGKQYPTLKSMYLEPIKKEFIATARPLNLIVDLKGNYKTILAQLIKELDIIKPLIHNKNRVTIIITGNRPPPSEYKNYPSYILFDDDLQIPHTKKQWKRVAQVSLNFVNYSKWKGEGPLPVTDERVLKSVINAVHAAGKKIRFWAAPDNASGWKKLMALNADILSTDKIDELLVVINNKQ